MHLDFKSIGTNFIIALIITGAGYYITSWQKILKLEERIKKMEIQINEIDSRGKPSYLTQDEWNMELGYSAFRRKDYERAIEYFNKINDLKDNEFVKWKYYFSLSKFRILQFKKYRKTVPIDKEEAEKILHTLKMLMDNYPKNRYSEGIAYWYAQTLYHFLNKPQEALHILKKLQELYPWGKWKEGTAYYYAMILSKSGNERDLKIAIMYLERLIAEHPKGIIKIIEDNSDYRVDDIVVKKLQELKKRKKLMTGDFFHKKNKEDEDNI